jgi:hypothetical protein
MRMNASARVEDDELVAETVHLAEGDGGHREKVP